MILASTWYFDPTTQDMLLIQHISRGWRWMGSRKRGFQPLNRLHSQHGRRSSSSRTFGWLGGKANQQDHKRKDFLSGRQIIPASKSSSITIISASNPSATNSLAMERNQILSSPIGTRTTNQTKAIPSMDAKYHLSDMMGMLTFSYQLLQKQNAETSNAVIHYFDRSEYARAAADFTRLANYEGALTAKRDQEDDDKLQTGIDYAKSKGVIDPNYVPQPYVDIDVLGKTPDQVADQILQQVRNDSGAVVESGVIVLVGLSGTGKGTTVTKLRQKLEDEQGKQVVTWSNGNIFRSVTLLAATWCEQQPNGPVDIQQALAKENLANFMSMLSFGKFGDDDKYDTRIQGLGLDLLVSQVQNTVLKSPKVSQNIPTVAEVTQGEVILFAAEAMKRMTTETPNLFVLLEGRAQTVNYVPTPYRFCLILSDGSLIGKRRAAQRLMAQSLRELRPPSDSWSSTTDSPDSSAVEAALNKALQSLVRDIPKSKLRPSLTSSSRRKRRRLKVDRRTTKQNS
ncbi:hypothetical protein ACA910_012226 [Epithemia clementina (nom. ined.)]